MPELKEMAPKELRAMLNEKQEELRKMRFKSSQGQFPEVRKIRDTKKLIASLIRILQNETK